MINLFSYLYWKKIFQHMIIFQQLILLTRTCDILSTAMVPGAMWYINLMRSWKKVMLKEVTSLGYEDSQYLPRHPLYLMCSLSLPLTLHRRVGGGDQRCLLLIEAP